jgi:hypothetical protein
MLDRTTLEKILNDADSTTEERELAQRQLTIDPLTTEDDPYSADATAMLIALGKSELFQVSQTEFDVYCDTHGIAGDRRTALEDERAAYLLPPDDELRLFYLADPATDIHWGWLLALRNNLEWAGNNKRARAHALRAIRMISRSDKIPADVREASVEFLDALADAKQADPIPSITAPDAETWKTMPDEELYRRADALRQMLSSAARRRYGSE